MDLIYVMCERDALGVWFTFLTPQPFSHLHNLYFLISNKSSGKQAIREIQSMLEKCECDFF